MTERTIGQLVADATRDVSDLVRHEIALAKAELKRDVAKAGQGAGMLGAAAFLGAVAFVLLCVAAAYGLVAVGLATWLGFLIVAAVLLLLAGVLALVGKGRLQKVTPPERTIATSKDTVAALKGQPVGRPAHGQRLAERSATGRGVPSRGVPDRGTA